jgi:hypothetical protein
VSERDPAYVCPNGHAVDAVRVVNCSTCRAGVVYEPIGRRMAAVGDLRAALSELGEPQPGYPAPVVNAICHMRAALRALGAR